MSLPKYRDGGHRTNERAAVGEDACFPLLGQGVHAGTSFLATGGPEMGRPLPAALRAPRRSWYSSFSFQKVRCFLGAGHRQTPSHLFQSRGAVEKHGKVSKPNYPGDKRASRSEWSHTSCGWSPGRAQPAADAPALDCRRGAGFGPSSAAHDPGQPEGLAFFLGLRSLVCSFRCCLSSTVCSPYKVLDF